MVNYLFRDYDEFYWLGTQTSDQPVEFEVTEENDRLPALVETKEIVKPHGHQIHKEDDDKDDK